MAHEGTAIFVGPAKRLATHSLCPSLLSARNQRVNFQHEFTYRCKLLPCSTCRQGGLQELVLRVGCSNCEDLAFWRYREVGGSVCFSESIAWNAGRFCLCRWRPRSLKCCIFYACPGSAFRARASSPCSGWWYSSNTGSPFDFSREVRTCLKSENLTLVKPRTLPPTLKPMRWCYALMTQVIWRNGKVTPLSMLLMRGWVTKTIFSQITIQSFCSRTHRNI